MPYYLGWIYTGGTLTKYDSSTIYVKLTQTGSSNTKVMKVYRPSYVSSTGNPVGTCTYYQWGRKDPFKDGKYTTSSSSSNTVTKAINTPSVFNSSGGFGQVYNLWSTNYNASAASNGYLDVHKSIYDPCPAGYQLLENTAFGYNAGNILTYTSSDKSFTDGDGKVFYLPFVGWISSSGSPAQQTDLFFCTAHCSGSGNFQYYSVVGTTWNMHSSTYTNCMPVLPAQDSSYDPTDDGTTRGSGTSIVWVN